MNRVLVAGIAGLAMLLTASVTTQESYAGFGRSCGGNDFCSGGLLSKLGSRCGGREARSCGGGLLAKLKSRKADCCGEVASCCAPEPACCPAPAPVCCPAPAPACCPAPAPCCAAAAAPCCESTCCAPKRTSRLRVRQASCCPAPACGGCDSCGTVAGCPSCSTTIDSGAIIESDAPSVAPPAPAPVADPAASASDAPAA